MRRLKGGVTAAADAKNGVGPQPLAQSTGYECQNDKNMHYYMCLKFPHAQTTLRHNMPEILFLVKYNFVGLDEKY